MKEDEEKTWEAIAIKTGKREATLLQIFRKLCLSNIHNWQCKMQSLGCGVLSKKAKTPMKNHEVKHFGTAEIPLETLPKHTRKRMENYVRKTFFA